MKAEPGSRQVMSSRARAALLQEGRGTKTVIKVDFAQIAGRIVNTCADIRRGENVLIVGRDDHVDYCYEIALASARREALPLIVIAGDKLNHGLLTEMSTSYLCRTKWHYHALMQRTDVCITTSFEAEDPSLFTDIPPAKLTALNQAGKPVSETLYDGSRRWVGTDVPTPQQAATYGVPFEEFHDIFWKGMMADPRSMHRQAGSIAALAGNAGHIRITSPKGTDLVLSCRGRPADLDDGIISPEAAAAGRAYLNLPAGEVCLAPVEDSAQGTVVFDLAFRDGVRIEDLRVAFEQGVCNPLEARAGLDEFRSIVAGSSGDKDRIGELGIGINPSIQQPTGFLLCDEKIGGSVHLAIGENRFLGGVNNSDLHWDLLILRPTLTIDGTTVIDEGRIVLPPI